VELNKNTINTVLSTLRFDVSKGMQSDRMNDSVIVTISDKNVVVLGDSEASWIHHRSYI